MILNTTILLITTIAFRIFLALNPARIGLIILFISLTLSVAFAYSMSSWVAFLIFLIYIGGMLVIFSYFVSIIPNQTIIIIKILLTIIMSFTILYISSSILNIHVPINNQYYRQFNVLYEEISLYILITLASILLFTIIVVVKLTSLSKGPLRPFIYV